MQLRSILSAAAITLVTLGMAQSECSEYWKSAPRSGDSRFTVNGQSRGASIQVGVPTELNVIIYKGQDYRVSFVYDEKIIGDHVIARIIEKVRQPKPVKDANGQADQGKPVFEDNTKVIWDNQDHEMTDAVEFTATSTKRIAIEVTAPGIPEDPKSKNSGKKMTDIGCLGILIEHMPTPAIGF
ncbi:MAG: hypothetical protein IPO60_06915 [Flavobacteriales bacterium]|jgi:hypothetical protein|nr:hypothetical protein [Flavobacteriales bacterium]MBK9598050.1 hypothetical protein [Flavobacteriales bacterium]